MDITIYSGEHIKQLTSCPAELESVQCQDGEAYIEGHYHWDEYYMRNGTPTLRPELPATIDRTNLTADGIDTATITNLPNPSTVTVNRQSVTVEDGTLELTFDLPGSYVVKVESFPYLPWEVAIHAT
jgi:hypothetical protein